MTKDELLGYIKKELDMGAPKEKIVSYLQIGGWSAPDIEKAFIDVQKTKRDGLFGLLTEKDVAKNHGRYWVWIWNIFTLILLLIITFLIIAYIVGGEA